MSHKLASTCYYYHQQIRENQFFHARVLTFIFDVFFQYVLTTTNPKDTVTFICFNLQGIVTQKKKHWFVIYNIYADIYEIFLLGKINIYWHISISQLPFNG